MNGAPSHQHAAFSGQAGTLGSAPKGAVFLKISAKSEPSRWADFQESDKNRFREDQNEPG